MSSTEATPTRADAAELRFYAACLAEPTAEALPALREAAGWQPWLAEPLAELAATDLEVWQGEHARLFVVPGLAPPFASAYREGILNGAAASAAEAYYADQGFALSEGLPGDYLGSLLECEAWLVEAGQAQEAATFRQTFLADWLGRFAGRLREHARLAFYRRLGERLADAHDVVLSLGKRQVGMETH
ncbi:MAG: molecular chaperone TorD family protein [Gammaproteobacteria bacterium]|jgi:TorA maturation chaperone TorD